MLSYHIDRHIYILIFYNNFYLLEFHYYYDGCCYSVFLLLYHFPHYILYILLLQ
eukprot:UN02566